MSQHHDGREHPRIPLFIRNLLPLVLIQSGVIFANGPAGSLNVGIALAVPGFFIGQWFGICHGRRYPAEYRWQWRGFPLGKVADQ